MAVCRPRGPCNVVVVVVLVVVAAVVVVVVDVVAWFGWLALLFGFHVFFFILLCTYLYYSTVFSCYQCNLVFSTLGSFLNK
jgi:hypothetical protein